ncbi:alpha/beta hydrolase [Pelodictyon phaeoclathratiforme]|jgi:predicted esterase|uniref:Phospholipase/carboxylesterase n=1 Tax=Pelodictyon phaeoclathratiforme (strain DSM 5477 / BU-1) TaxID=324925 RepID=B4SGJ6_PELPB|nr:phospholipase [Pelodictyon phaeoclathratiforme]ACF44932.1 phospholipase/carboxylesterase [Pelodictyon phaeoclathratiforme BU-1]MBV5288718.1 phospholipase [Pelodictyon phaeoclathratiforme]
MGNWFRENVLQVHTIETSVSGKYLLRLPADPGTAPLLAGFHGYGQTAEDEFRLLCAIPGSDRWFCCSIEALHSLYTAAGNPGASWMTSCDREQHIEENVRYVDAVIERIRALHDVNDRLCFHGFSQGTGMACRAALLGRYPAERILLLGGDIPPELAVSGRMGRVHLARGTRDQLYSQERYERDVARLQEGGIAFVACSFTGGHRVNEAYYQAAGEFLEGE